MVEFLFFVSCQYQLNSYSYNFESFASFEYVDLVLLFLCIVFLFIKLIPAKITIYFN